MSESHVDLVRRGLDAFNRKDAGAVLETLHPDAELVPMRSLLEGGAYQGHQGLRRFMEEMDDDWETYRLAGEEFRAVGPDRVLVLGRVVATGRASGVAVDSPAAWLCYVRDGRVTRVRFYSDPAEAIEAAGLE
jgi:ketosteroid isomerase-like protein